MSYLGNRPGSGIVGLGDLSPELRAKLGNFLDYKAVTTSPVSLVAADAGLLINCYASASVLNLPAVADVAPGATFTIYPAMNITVNRAGSDQLVRYPGDATMASSFVIPAGSPTRIVAIGSGLWLVDVQGAGLSSMAANGWQKLTSGLIIQWGSGTTSAGGSVAVTFPMAFPNAAYQVLISDRATSVGTGSQDIASADDPTLTGFTAYTCTDAGVGRNSSFRWLAIGQ